MIYDNNPVNLNSMDDHLSYPTKCCLYVHDVDWSCEDMILIIISINSNRISIMIRTSYHSRK